MVKMRKMLMGGSKNLGLRNKRNCGNKLFECFEFEIAGKELAGG